MARKRRVSSRKGSKKELPKATQKTAHTVSEGETASKVVTRYHMGLRKLLDLNELESINQVTGDTRLLIEQWGEDIVIRYDKAFIQDFKETDEGYLTITTYLIT